MSGKSPHIKTGQGNPLGGKEPQEESKESKLYPLPLLGVSREANSHSTCTKNLVQTHAGPWLAISTSVNPREPCLVDVVDHVLLVPSISSGSNLFSPSFIPLSFMEGS